MGRVGRSDVPRRYDSSITSLRVQQGHYEITGYKHGDPGFHSITRFPFAKCKGQTANAKITRGDEIVL